MAGNLPQPPLGFVIQQNNAAAGSAPEPPPGFVLEPPRGNTAYSDALATASAASQTLQGGPGPSDAVSAGQWVTPGEGEGGVPIVSDIMRSLYPFERNTVTGDMRLAVPKAITGTVQSIGDAFTAPHDALAGDMSAIEVDPATGEVLPFSTEMMDRAENAAGWMTGGAPGAPKTIVHNAAGKTVPEPIVRAARADGVSLNGAAAQLDNIGPDAVLADLGPNLRAQAAAVASRPGAASADTVIDAMSARKAGASQRVRQGLDETLGQAPIPSQLKADIQKAKRVVGPEYDKVLASAPPVDTTQIADVLDSLIETKRGAAQSALRDVRSMLNDFEGGLDTSATVLHQVREAVDGMLENPPDGNTRAALKGAREQINELLTEAVPAIRHVDSRYRELMRQSEAVDRGQTVLDSNRNAPRPAELADEVQAGALPQGTLVGPSGTAFRLSQGVRAEIERIVGTNVDDRAALGRILKGEGDWNRERLATIYGPERGQRLFDLLDAEARMADTENAVLGAAGRRAKASASVEVDPPKAAPGAAHEVLNLQAGSAVSKVLDDLFGGHADARQSKRVNGVGRELVGRGDWRTTQRAPMSAAPVPLESWMSDIFGRQDADQVAQPPRQSPVNDDIRALLLRL